MCAQVITTLDVNHNQSFECYVKTNFEINNRWEIWHYAEINQSFRIKANEGDTVKVILISNPFTDCSDTTRVTVIGSKERMKYKEAIRLDGKKRIYGKQD